MNRNDIINTIGQEFLDSNTEKGEYSYSEKHTGLSKEDLKNLTVGKDKTNMILDMRFSTDKLVVLVETKQKINSKKKWEEATSQLQSYLNIEKEINKLNKKIVSMLVSLEDSEIKVYFGDDLKINEEHLLKEEKTIKHITHYEDLYFGTKNNKEEVMKNTYELNELLHKFGIHEAIRSQLVGTCLLALKQELKYDTEFTKEQIIVGIEEKIDNLFSNSTTSNKKEKLDILRDKVLKAQDIKDLKSHQLVEILDFVKNKILPFINEKNTQGQDLLNLFFTTFNKYVGKKDKNQAFTPDHIVQFMCEVANINKNSVVLDPCCGSGSFLVRAMTSALDDCQTEKEKDEVKKHHIFGFEFEEKAYGLATTNMLIHGDGNSNIIKDSCFNYDKEWYERNKINTVLMNPPYNAARKHSEPEYVANWDIKTSMDPSKGFHFVYDVASKMDPGGILLVLLPTACAIGSTKDIRFYKKKMLQGNSLEAVFSLPPEIFYPGASASACCMVFKIGVPHKKNINKKTFFGYYKDDGFVKRKNIGRVEKIENGKSVWEKVFSEWKKLYSEKIETPGKSVMKEVTEDDEWLAEAHMETDYSNLSDSDFEKTIREFISYKIKFGSNIDE